MKMETFSEYQPTVLLIGLIAFVVCVLLYIFYPAIVAATVNHETIAAIVVRHPKQRQPHHAVLSIVIPAYNEEFRLAKMLTEAYEYLVKPQCPILTKLQSRSVEWILVSDGSIDATATVYRSFVESTHDDDSFLWKMIHFPENRGKGAAVQAGMLAATGDYCLMVDADGATEFGTGLTSMSLHLNTNTVLLGSRRSETTKRSILRKCLKSVFRMFVVVFVGQFANSIEDTQCGFKLFPNPKIFENLHLRRWAFDTEILYVSHHLNYEIKEVAVNWQEIDGSKLHTSLWNLAICATSMLRDMVCIRLCYALGIWKIHNKVE